MSALHHHAEALPMACRSAVSGRYIPASRQLADRLDAVEAALDGGYEALAPLDALAARAAAGPLGPEDVEALRRLHNAVWSALDVAAERVEAVRELVGGAA